MTLALHRPSNPGEAQTPGRLQPSAVATLFLGSSAGAVITALVGVACLAHRVDFATLRNLELFGAILGPPGGPRFDLARWEFAFPLESLLSRSFNLVALDSLLRFAALALTVTLIVFWLLSALLGLPVAVAARVSLRRCHRQVAQWTWRVVYPLGVVLAFSTPGFLMAGHAALAGRGATVIVQATGCVIVGAYITLLWALRNADLIRRLVHVSFVSSLVLAGLTWAAAGAAFALAGRWSTQSPAARNLPNILLVSIDSLRSDHVHRYGYARETTPTIDRLADEGAWFRTVVSPASWTLPAHLTLLTALPPELHGVVDDGTRLTERAVFLAQVLRRAGYATAGFVSAPYLDSQYGFSQGFDHYDDYTIARRSFDASEHHGSTSPTLLRIVSAWIAQWHAAQRERPFFVFMHMWDVHYDYTPPPPYDSMFDPEYRGTVNGENYWLNAAVHNGMDPRDLAHIVALYDGGIRFTDLYLGYVLDELRRLGVLDRTLVVVTADHGDEFFEHGQKGHKKTLYDESILVPLVIRFPAKVPAGRAVEDQVRFMDIAPTIIALAGLPRQPDFGPAGLQGPQAPQSLIPWITADSTAALPALPAFSDLVGEAPVPIAAIRAHGAKFIKEQRGKCSEQLYDLLNDPAEQTNLLRAGRSVVGPLPQALASWRGTWAGSTPMAKSVTASEEHKERLRALGYTQ